MIPNEQKHGCFTKKVICNQPNEASINPILFTQDQHQIWCISVEEYNHLSFLPMMSSQHHSHLHPIFFYFFYCCFQIMERLGSVLLQRPQCSDPVSCGSFSLLAYKEVIVVVLNMIVCTSIRTVRPSWGNVSKAILASLYYSCPVM